MDRIIEESGFRIIVPRDASFRFADSTAYRQLGGRRVSEMDVGYWDEAHQWISLLEVKDFSVHEPLKALLPKLVAKGRDSLVMLHAVWHDLSDIARALRGDLPDPCRSPKKVRLLFVLRVGAGFSREQLLPIKDDVEHQIKAYAELLGFSRIIVAVMDHEKAVEKGLPLTVLSAE